MKFKSTVFKSNLPIEYQSGFTFDEYLCFSLPGERFKYGEWFFKGLNGSFYQVLSFKQKQILSQNITANLKGR